MEYGMIISVLIIIILIICIFRLHRFSQKRFENGVKSGQEEILSLFLASGFSMRLHEFKSLNKYIKKNQIVFVGDSITQEYAVDEYFPNLTVYNRGIGGDTTSGLLTRMKESIFDLEPSTIILMIGTNDFGLLNATPEEVYKNIKEIVRQIQNQLPKTRIIVESLYPVSKQDNPQIDPLAVGIRTNQQIDQVNAMIKTIENIEYIDINSLLKDENGNFKINYTREGLHCSPEGYELITSILMKYLMKEFN